MTELQPTQPSTDKPVVSPRILAGLFEAAADAMLRTEQGQRLGSYIVGFDRQVHIKQHPVRGRVTHAKLLGVPADTYDTPLVTTHEVHFPSSNVTQGDFGASKAIFETHTHDTAGQRTHTQRAVLSVIDMSGLEMQPYWQQIKDLI